MSFTSAGIDIGIVVRDGPAALAFYVGVLGLHHQGDNPFPNGGVMHRLMAGESMVKIVVPEPPPAVDAPRGGIPGASGYRYITFSIDDLDAKLDACRSAGVPITQDAVEMAPGIRIALVDDPAGNVVEFLEHR